MSRAMKRIAIIGGGISGLACAYELENARKAGAAIDWHLYEASDRLGGIVETTVRDTDEGRFVLEGGPDGWVSDKPWARELAVELGLESELIYSNDATRKTYILRDGKLLPIPDGMRMMVPTDLSALEGSPLFSEEAKRAYAAEIERAEELKAAAPENDESVASFVRRHFGDEVLDTLAAPLLSGVFGGDVHKLSVQSVMMAFVAMEREHGSLILALQAKAEARGERPQQPIFTSLLNGLGSLIQQAVATLPNERLFLRTPAIDVGDENRWYVIVDESRKLIGDHYDEVVIATSLDASSELLRLDGDHSLRKLLPTDASSAILAAFTWSVDLAQQFTIPPGFGFLVPPQTCHPERSEGSASRAAQHEPQLLACTFVDQKFPHRAPDGARVLRAFFGGESAEQLSAASDELVAQTALAQLRAILGPMPEPTSVEVRRWPRSLPQYEVGHLERIAQLDELLARVPGLHLLGNSYRGVGLPDLIRDARATARKIVDALERNADSLRE
jgi:oxygen-dependent protoporphyrinogen oxidase